MSASQLFLVGMAVAYFGAAIAYVTQAAPNYGMALTMACYGVANIGMLLGVK